MDMNLSNDPYESYRIFQGRIVEQYEAMVESEGLVAIDANRVIEEQQLEVRDRVTRLIAEKGIGAMAPEALQEYAKR
jgi:dTMP kinase